MFATFDLVKQLSELVIRDVENFDNLTDKRTAMNFHFFLNMIFNDRMQDEIKKARFLKTLEKRHSRSNISLYDMFSPIKRKRGNEIPRWDERTAENV